MSFEQIPSPPPVISLETERELLLRWFRRRKRSRGPSNLSLSQAARLCSDYQTAESPSGLFNTAAVKPRDNVSSTHRERPAPGVLLRSHIYRVQLIGVMDKCSGGEGVACGGGVQSTTLPPRRDDEYSQSFERTPLDESERSEGTKRLKILPLGIINIHHRIDGNLARPWDETGPCPPSSIRRMVMNRCRSLTPYRPVTRGPVRVTAEEPWSGFGDRRK